MQLAKFPAKQNQPPIMNDCDLPMSPTPQEVTCTPKPKRLLMNVSKNNQLMYLTSNIVNVQQETKKELRKGQKRAV